MTCEKCGGELDDFLGLCPDCDIQDIHELSVEFGFDSPYEDDDDSPYDDLDFGFHDDVPVFPNSLLHRCPSCHTGKMMIGDDGLHCNVCAFFEPIT